MKSDWINEILQKHMGPTPGPPSADFINDHRRTNVMYLEATDSYCTFFMRDIHIVCFSDASIEDCMCELEKECTLSGTYMIYFERKGGN